MILKENKINLMFIHINKCGGTSVKNVLKTCNNVLIPNNNSICKLIKSGVYFDYVKFTIVRHPISRFNSFVKMCIRDGRDFKSVDYLIDIATGNLDNVTHLNMATFENYVKRHTLPMSHPFYGVVVDGKVAVDHYYKLEDIDSSWVDICRLIGVETLNLPRLNKTNSEFILNRDQIRRLVAYYSNDFYFFGYSQAEI